MALNIEQVSALRHQLWIAGLRPVPVYNYDDKGPSPGKRPLGVKWQLDALRDPPFCAVNPAVPHAQNTGVLCDGLRAIDIDVDDAALAARCLELARQMLPPAPRRFREGSSRCLLVYRAAAGEPPNAPSVTGASHDPKGQSCKIEVLGKGHQFVAVGRHHSGAELQWQGELRLDALALVTEDQINAYRAAAAPIIDAPPPGYTNGKDHKPAGEGELHGEFLAIARDFYDIDNSAPSDWPWWAVRVGAIHAALGDTPEAWAIVRDWSARNPAYDPAEVEQKWRQVCRSPFTGVGAKAIGDWAARDRRARERREQENDAPPYQAEAFTAASLAALEAYQWVFRRFMVARYFCALGAPPGTGKSALIVIVALSIVTGRALLGGEAPEQANAWIINLEDPREAILKMIWACCQHYGIEPVELEGRLFVNSGRDRRLTIATMVDGTVLRAPVMDNLVQQCIERDIRALFVDPVVDTHSLPENDNIAMNDYCALWNGLAETADCAVLLSMHFRKGGQGGDPEAFRGASAIIGKARAAITLAIMSQIEADKLGVSQDHRAYHLRLDNAKRNLSPPPTAAEWLRLESVSITTGDSIQALRSWSPPAPFDGFSMAQVVVALEQIDAGPGEGEFYTASKQSRSAGRWCGSVLTERAEKTPGQADAIINQWLQSGLLVKDSYFSPVQRKQRQCVRVDRAKLAEMRAAAGPLPETPWDC